MGLWVGKLPVLRSSSGTRVPVEKPMRKQKCRDGKDVEQPIYDTSRFGKSSQRTGRLLLRPDAGVLL
jgi:hypothetical protein